MIRHLFLADHRGILGINRRNLDYVYSADARSFFHLADDKLEAKKIFSEAGVPTPKTLHVVDGFDGVVLLPERFSNLEHTVLKPNRGAGGRGILLIGEPVDGGFFATDGSVLTIPDLQKHCAEIVMGSFSFGGDDKVLIEERLQPHPFFSSLYPVGLADFRLIFYRKKAVMAMIRVPTSGSAGKANLHQGGVGIGIDLDTGKTRSAIHLGSYIDFHPDTGSQLDGLDVPFLEEITNYALRIAEIVPLNYIGFDFTLDSRYGPMILEINARPGLEIQKANRQGLLEVLL